MRTLKLALTQQQIADLQTALNKHPKPYVRERASAILQIHQGKPGYHVAQQGLLRKRRENTLYEWVHRFNQDGMASLLVQPGRGRKAAHSPPQPPAGTGSH